MFHTSPSISSFILISLSLGRSTSSTQGCYLNREPPKITPEIMMYETQPTLPGIAFLMCDDVTDIHFFTSYHVASARVHLDLLLPLAVRFSLQLASRYQWSPRICLFEFCSSGVRCLTTNDVPHFTFNLQFHPHQSVAWSLHFQHSRMLPQPGAS